jgi:hypothetical protein
MTVLGTAAGLDADDPLDLDLRPTPTHPHLVRELERVRHTLVRQPQNLERLRFGQANLLL